MQKKHFKIINFHNSLLPLHRGLNAQMWSIFKQDLYSGISWHIVREGIDTGEILIQKQIKLNSRHTYLSLTKEQLELGFSAFVEICDSLLQWNSSLKAQITQSCDSTLHKSADLPNKGYLDLSWDLAQKSAFLRSMDCKNSKILPKPKVKINGIAYEILGYKQDRRYKLGFKLTLREIKE